jgi:hypothetical protein
VVDKEVKTSPTPVASSIGATNDTDHKMATNNGKKKNGGKQKWVPLNIEPARPSSRGYFRHKGDSRDHWYYGRKDRGDFDNKDRRRGGDGSGGNRYDRGKEKYHRPMRFERDQMYRSGRDHAHRDIYPEEMEGGVYNGRGNWQGGAMNGTLINHAIIIIFIAKYLFQRILD